MHFLGVLRSINQKWPTQQMTTTEDQTFQQLLLLRLNVHLVQLVTVATPIISEIFNIHHQVSIKIRLTVFLKVQSKNINVRQILSKLGSYDASLPRINIINVAAGMMFDDLGSDESEEGDFSPDSDEGLIDFTDDGSDNESDDFDNFEGEE